MSTISQNNKRSTERTEILSDLDNIKNTILQFLSKANRIDSCGDYKAPSLTIEVEEYRRLLFDLKKRRIKVRYITDITKENIHYCKEMMKFVEEVRHLDGIKANFSVSETEYMTSTTLLQQETQPVQQVIYSNVKDIVEQQKYVFEALWSKAIPAEQRIREIEEGFVLRRTEIIQSPKDIQQLFINMVKSAKHEVLLVLPSINSFLREERIGIIELLKQATERGEDSINVRILTPTNDVIEKKLQNIVWRSEQMWGEGEQEQKKKKKNNFDIRHIDIESYHEEVQAAAEKITVTTVTIVVVDRNESLVIEKKDDSKENFIEVVGIATYSNSKPTVLSYISIFESLWSQVKLYEKLKEANEQLKIHDNMQKEFINIASHEMKTPTQAILGYSDLVQKHPEKREEMLNAISRNAIRLQKLTNDILDVTRIESQTLSLNKEQFNLNDLILDIVEDYRNQIEKDKDNVKLLYNHQPKKDDNFLSVALVEADKGRIAQVISNLLSNAIKFTKGVGQGTISVTARIEDNNQAIIISVKDTGTGINPEILPRLFTKFATKSLTGTGLGLFISKSIIEAHSGRMWTESNADGKGATFAFSLPLSEQSNSSRHREGTKNMSSIT